MSVVYEVNLELDPEIEQAYLDWLIPHIHEILTFQGFRDAQIFRVEATTESGRLGYCVQYVVASRVDLQHYFDHHAAAMRADGINRFGAKFSAQRRILAQKHHLLKKL